MLRLADAFVEMQVFSYGSLSKCQKSRAAPRFCAAAALALMAIWKESQLAMHLTQMLAISSDPALLLHNFLSQAGSLLKFDHLALLRRKPPLRLPDDLLGLGYAIGEPLRM
ncbi:hypothetical protein [Neoaquamicrobium sediminum]|uniref:hypothetical protein n=1 Tax=Neoaquamicrobium sediminum TaxID=1849104 RepID=UPI00156499DF|nr:hypothetical protein [Mesorhizobium sediminum]NRC56218.1 hypothetical protein [Mesorhizobium sediminum]